MKFLAVYKPCPHYSDYEMSFGFIDANNKEEAEKKTWKRMVGDKERVGRVFICDPESPTLSWSDPEEKAAETIK